MTKVGKIPDNSGLFLLEGFPKEGPILLSTGRTKGDTGRRELKEQLEKSIKEKTIR